MVVYIQKKINKTWRTVLTVDSVNAEQAYTHLCVQSCHHKFRISLDKTDDMPIKPKGLSLNEAMNALYAMNLDRSISIEIANIIYEVHRRYKR